MGILSGISDFFGLDIGTSALRVVQLKGAGFRKTLFKYGAQPIDSHIVLNATPQHTEQLGEAVRAVIKAHGITTKNVIANLPSDKVFSTVIDFPKVSPGEIDKTIRFQADSLIPTPIDTSRIDWAVVGPSPKTENQVEVLINSVANEIIERQLDLLEGIGLNVLAFEPDALSLARAIIDVEATDTQMLVDMGVHTTDLVIIFDGAPRLVRSINTGSGAIIRMAKTSLNISQKQAEQFIFKFGLDETKLEGHVAKAIAPAVGSLTNEIDKSIKFFSSRYPQTQLKQIVVTGGASVLPGFPKHLAKKFDLNIEIGNCWRNITYSATQHDELLTVSNHFGVAAGLAERQE